MKQSVSPLNGSEKVNPLPAYNPENLKAIAVLQATSQAEAAHTVAIQIVKKQPIKAAFLGFFAEK
nr:Uncharacterised protein [Raoultella sp. NCTC 9187]